MAAAAAAKVVHRCDTAKETGQLGKPESYFLFHGQVMSNHDSESEWDFLKYRRKMIGLLRSDHHNACTPMV